MQRRRPAASLGAKPFAPTEETAVRPTRRRPGRPLALATLLAALLALPAAAKNVVGTDSPETLTGTHGADRLLGLGGDDRLQGLAGNDVYLFGNGWGSDTLVEKPTYRVKGKKVPGGSDTLDFRGYTAGGVQVLLIPQWRGISPIFSSAGDFTLVDTVALGASRVENVIGTGAADTLAGAAGPNRLVSGGGSDDFVDYGGWNDGAGGRPELPPSDDRYEGVGATTGVLRITDFGGAADVVDLRPLQLGQVFMRQIDCDGDPAGECLQILTGVGAGEVLVIGQFGEYSSYTASTGQQGQIEALLFADKTVTYGTTRATRAAGGKTVDGTTLLGKATTPRQKRLAERAAAAPPIRPSDVLPRPSKARAGADGRGRDERATRHRRPGR